MGNPHISCVHNIQKISFYILHPLSIRFALLFNYLIYERSFKRDIIRFLFESSRINDTPPV